MTTIYVLSFQKFEQHNRHQLAGFNQHAAISSLMFTNILFWQRGYHGALHEFSHDIAYLIRITNHHIWWKTNHEKAWLVVLNFFYIS
jgi:hypothetical protein